MTNEKKEKSPKKSGSSEETQSVEEYLIEFSRPFNLEKVTNTGIYKFNIHAKDNELEALAKRFNVHKILSFQASFEIQKSKSMNRVNKVFEVDGEAQAEVIRDTEDLTEQKTQHFSFPIKLHLLEGDEEKYVKTMDWQLESAKDYDIEFYQNFLIDLGEIASQYLSLEIDPFVFADDMDFMNEFSESENKSNEQIKKNPFDILESLKKK